MSLWIDLPEAHGHDRHLLLLGGVFGDLSRLGSRLGRHFRILVRLSE